MTCWIDDPIIKNDEDYIRRCFGIFPDIKKNKYCEKCLKEEIKQMTTEDCLYALEIMMIYNTEQDKIQKEILKKYRNPEIPFCKLDFCLMSNEPENLKKYFDNLAQWKKTEYCRLCLEKHKPEDDHEECQYEYTLINGQYIRKYDGKKFNE